MRYALIVVAVILSACNTGTNQKPARLKPGAEVVHPLQGAVDAYSAGDVEGAVKQVDDAITACDKQYAGSEQRIYAARGTAETLYYMLKAASENESAIAVATDCSEALYLKAYMSLEQGQVTTAEEFIRRAIEMSPANSQYLSELGHILQYNKKWEEALEVFKQAEEFANSFTPDPLKDKELSRAKRGVGYTLIELGKLDEAEIKFRECLEIDKNDQGAIRELKYIEHIRKLTPESMR